MNEVQDMDVEDVTSFLRTFLAKRIFLIMFEFRAPIPVFHPRGIFVGVTLFFQTIAENQNSRKWV